MDLKRKGLVGGAGLIVSGVGSEGDVMAIGRTRADGEGLLKRQTANHGGRLNEWMDENVQGSICER